MIILDKIKNTFNDYFGTFRDAEKTFNVAIATTVLLVLVIGGEFLGGYIKAKKLPETSDFNTGIVVGGVMNSDDEYQIQLRHETENKTYEVIYIVDEESWLDCRNGEVISVENVWFPLYASVHKKK